MKKGIAPAGGRTARDSATRERLLRAGERLFAERGYKRVTVRDICRAARANVAAVNYHFGDKAGLYQEVLQIGIDVVRSTTDAGRRAGEGCPPEEKLRRYFSVFLQKALAPGHENLHRLIQREIDDPTAALDTFVDEAVRPRVDYVASIVAEMTGRDASDPVALRCVGSVLSQALLYVRQNPIAERLGFRFRGTPAEIEDAARHITDFSVAGICAAAAVRRSRDSA